MLGVSYYSNILLLGSKRVIFLINFGDIITVNVSINTLPPDIKCSLVFFLNV